MAILERIRDPQDLKHLKPELLPELASEIREKIISTTLETGGHLAGSLGAVELIIALHYVFDSPNDKIVFDVGHQAYAHKLLTGRYEQFSTLRQFGGISGFPKISESPHDAFGVGHASTAISAAFGMAVARDIKKENFHVIAVVGDGSLTGGLSYEGLNNAGSSGKDILVILNDNGMFISPSVGAVARILAKVFTFGLVKKAEETLVKYLKRMKFLGVELLKLARRIKVILFPDMLFEEMGFSCFGPVDGHNLKNLIFILSKLKKIKGPVFLHVVTRKGKGYAPAEKHPEKYHGISGPKKKVKTYSDVFGEVLCDLVEKDRRIVAITAAMTEGTGLEDFAKKFPERFYDCGIAEEHAVTFAAALAKEGLKPIVAIYSTFLQRSFDQIIHDVCLQNLGVVFAIDRAGLVGEDGPTHHGTFDISYLRLVPNMIVSACKDEKELKNLLYSSLKYGMPVAVRYPRSAVEGVEYDGDYSFIPAGKGEILKEGKDIYFIAIGSMVYPCLYVAQRLSSNGISAGVFNARFAKPVDVEKINEIAKKSKLLITVEENTICGGFGAAVLETMDGNLRNKLRIIAIPDRFITHGVVEILKKDAGIDAESIYEKTLSFLEKKS